MAKFKTVYNPRTKTKSVVAFTAADSDEFVAAVSKKEERATKQTTKDSDGIFELMHNGSTKLKTDAAGIIVSGTVTGTTFSGSGASLTSLNASNLGSGTVPSARLSLSASDIPNLATSKVTSGTFADARIPSLNASKITAGTLDSARLPLGTFGGGGGGSGGLDSTHLTNGTLTFIDADSATFEKVAIESGGLTIREKSAGVDGEIKFLAASSTFPTMTISMNNNAAFGGRVEVDKTDAPLNLVSKTGDVKLLHNTENAVWAKRNGAVEIYYDNVKKLETTSTGTDITGTLGVTTVDLGNWTITESSGVLYFATGGTNKMKLDASGNLTVVGNVTAYGTM